MFSRPEEVVEALYDKLIQRGELGLAFVGRYDEKKIPEYPAVVLSAMPLEKEVHGTHTFNIQIRINLWVYHSKVNETHATRSLNDLLLATAIVNFLEADINLSGNVIHGFVESETPGIMQSGTTKTTLVIGTRLVYWCITQSRF